jgi:hypothetical protein
MLRQFKMCHQPVGTTVDSDERGAYVGEGNDDNALMKYGEKLRQEEAGQALQEEKDRVVSLQKENESLRNELWCLKANNGLAGIPASDASSLPAQLQKLPKLLANGSSIQLSISVGFSRLLCSGY